MIWNYDHPEKFDSFDKVDLKEHGDNIVLYGAGRIGGMAAHCLKKRKINVLAFCDSAEYKHGTEYCGIPVISPTELKEKYPNAIVLITTVFSRSVQDTLFKLGFQNMYDCTDLLMKIDFTNYDFWMKPQYAIRMVEQYLAAMYSIKKNISRVDAIYLVATTRCTLRCTECSSFVPYIADSKDYTADELLTSLDKVLDILGSVRVVNFYGGEPLLCKSLARMITKLRNEKRIEQIQISTNGTILPDDNLLSVLDDPRILFRVSKYEGNAQQKISELDELLSVHKIKHEIINYKYWDAGAKIQNCNDSPEELERKLLECTSCGIIYILGDKAFLCSPACFYYAVDETCSLNKEFADLNGDITTVEASFRALTERLRTGEHLELCKYCTGVHAAQLVDKVPVAVQTKSRLFFPEPK